MKPETNDTKVQAASGIAEEKMKTAAVVLAAGQGSRMQTAVAKQFLDLDGKPVIFYALNTFEESSVDRVVLVAGADEIEFCQKEIVEKYGFSKVCAVVAGGKERYHSVYAGLCALEEYLFPDGIVLIHDGARPLVEQALIEETIAAAEKWGAAVAAVPVKDTIKIADQEQFAAQTLDRSTLWQMQTPQTFSYPLIRRAYDRLLSDEQFQVGVTDDAMVAECMAAARVKLVNGSYENIKVTTPEDMAIAAGFLQRRKEA